MDCYCIQSFKDKLILTPNLYFLIFFWREAILSFNFIIDLTKVYYKSKEWVDIHWSTCT